MILKFYFHPSWVETNSKLFWLLACLRTTDILNSRIDSYDVIECDLMKCSIVDIVPNSIFSRVESWVSTSHEGWEVSQWIPLNLVTRCLRSPPGSQWTMNTARTHLAAPATLVADSSSICIREDCAHPIRYESKQHFLSSASIDCAPILYHSKTLLAIVEDDDWSSKYCPRFVISIEIRLSFHKI